MKKTTPALFSTLILSLLVNGCAKKDNSLESDLPTVESFVVEKISDGSSFTHSVEYVFVYPEGMNLYKSFPPLLWNEGGPPEGESFLLSRLNPQGKAEETFYNDGRRLHTQAKYDLSGLLSSEHTNYIQIHAGGKNDMIISVSKLIEN